MTAALGVDVAHVTRPVTQEQATAALLRLVRSPLIGNVDDDESCGATLLRIHDGAIYERLSAGEQRLVDIACNVWSGREDFGARISAIGGLDVATRRRVLVVLAYYFCGDGISLHAAAREFDELFIGDHE